MVVQWYSNVKRKVGKCVRNSKERATPFLNKSRVDGQCPRRAAAVLGDMDSKVPCSIQGKDEHTGARASSIPNSDAFLFRSFKSEF